MPRKPDIQLALWPQGAPGAMGTGAEDKPWLEVYKPAAPTGAAVLICPGGGYQMRAGHEAAPVAEWLNTLGITGIVVHYRVKPYHHPQPLNDLGQAMRLARRNATDWAINATQIGVLGFSAGGHLAATLCTKFESDTRPDLAILLYPVITLGAPSAHTGSRNNLLPDPNDSVQVDDLSNERHVTSATPPTFIFHTVDDAAVPVENALLYASALRVHHVPFAMHLFEKGQHGVGLASDDPALSMWTLLCANWLRLHGFAR